MHGIRRCPPVRVGGPLASAMSLKSLLALIFTSSVAALRFPRPIGRELIAGAITPPILGGVVAAGIAGSSEPEGRVLSFVPRRLQEAMRESRIAWIMLVRLL